MGQGLIGPDALTLESIGPHGQRRVHQNGFVEFHRLDQMLGAAVDQVFQMTAGNQQSDDRQSQKSQQPKGEVREPLVIDALLIGVIDQFLQRHLRLEFIDFADPLINLGNAIKAIDVGITNLHQIRQNHLVDHLSLLPQMPHRVLGMIFRTNQGNGFVRVRQSVFPPLDRCPHKRFCPLGILFHFPIIGDDIVAIKIDAIA